MKNHRELLRPRVRPSRRVQAFVILMLGIALVIGAVAYYEKARLDAHGASRKTARAATLSAAAGSQMNVAELKQWQALQQAVEFQWGAIFHVIEETASDDIELLDFAPDKESRRIVLRGMAKDDTALAGYLTDLAAQPRLRHVHLVHRMQEELQGVVTINFQVVATLYEPGSNAARSNGSAFPPSVSSVARSR